MKSCVSDLLSKKGYDVNTKAQELIRECDSWYSNKVLDFHKRKTVQGASYELNRLGFAKRCCSDDANLCEVVEINAGEKEEQNNAVNKILTDNQFNTQYRRQLEKTSADGTVGCYIRLDNATIMSDGSIKKADIRLNYIEAENYIPLTVVNDVVTEAAFCGTALEKGVETTTLVIFTLSKKGLYEAETHVFQKDKEVNERQITVTLGDVKPFAIMRNAEVNNLEDMDGYGLPKIHNAIPFLKGLDLAYNVLYSDLDKAEKIVIVNELLCEIDELTGKARFTPEQKKLFLMIGQGEKLPEEKSLIQEYNPIIRDASVENVIKLLLSLLSMIFGYGTKKYSFEDGQITTATEYIGERQDQMQELNRQRQEATSYIQDICKAVMWASNTFNKTSYDLNTEVLIDYDDSYITDRATELERKRNDALAFDIPILLVWYMMDAYNLTEEDAKKYIAEGKAEEPDEPDED